jgi:hypothetical protein
MSLQIPSEETRTPAPVSFRGTAFYRLERKTGPHISWADLTGRGKEGTW